MKRYLIETSVENAEGSQCWYVDASSESEALEKYREGGCDLYSSDVDVTSLGEPEISGETTLDDFGDFAEKPAQPEPAFNGWKLVPVKPTHTMETAIGKSRNLSASEIWEDAITAAPQPLQQVLTAAVIYEAVKHGDAKHQEWLRHALENVFAGRPVLQEATAPLAEQPAQPQQASDPDECASDVFEHGTSLGLFDMPKEDAEKYCKAETERTGYKHDWHYIGGRVHVKALITPQPAQPQQMPEDWFKGMPEQYRSEAWRIKAQQQQEPVPPCAYESLNRDMATIAARQVPIGIPISEFAMHALADAELREHAAAPQPAQRKPLTDEETKVLWHKARFCIGSNRWTVFKKLIEAAHGIKE